MIFIKFAHWLTMGRLFYFKQKQMRKCCAILFLYVISFMRAQFYTLPNHWVFQQIQDYNILASDTNISTGVYPLNPFVSSKFSNKDTNDHLFRYIKNDPALDILFQKDLISVNKDNFQIRINPLFNLQKGMQTVDTNISSYTNTRGFIASFRLKNVYIETMLSENQSIFPTYLYDYAKNTQVVPGQGRWKVFKQSGFDYAFSAGMVSIQASKNINISVGTGKQKIGNGYRSLLLSDNAFVYPFVKIEQVWWKGRLQYICNYAVLNNLVSASQFISPNTERLFQKKPFVYQYLNVGITKHTRIGLFQGIVGEPADRRNVWRGDGILFSPVIFSQLLYYGFNQKNNVIAGLDIQHKLLKTLMIYGQFVLDGAPAFLQRDDRYGYQIGWKWLAKFNDWRVLLLSEWNDVKDATYSSTPPYNNTSYVHFNQNMSYTLDNGNEWLSMFALKKKRWIASAQYHLQQTVFSDTKYYKIMIGFILNPSYNLMINAGIENRVAQKNSNYIYIQLQTSLYNIYYDF